MSKQIEEHSHSSSRQTPFSVEVMVREVDAEAPASRQGKILALLARRDRAFRVLVLCAAMALAGTYVGARANRSWGAADDGALSQSALRVFEGQLPHRDFSEIYTGGLSFIHALAFHAFGVNLLSLRICVFLFFLTWIPAIYYVALRFTPPLAAGAVTLLAVAWSFPNYTAAMPSWYNLFFATFGAVALLRYLEVRTRRWLFIAGICGGISILIKVIGAYYIAGVFLFLAFLEQSEDEPREARNSSWGYRAFSASALLMFIGTLIYMLHSRLGLGEFYHFVLPSAVVVGLILLGELKVGAASGARFAMLLRLLIPFVCGVLIPVIIFLIPYALSGSLRSFVSGVTSSAISHAVALAVARPAPPQYIVFVLPLIGLLAAAMYLEQFQGRVVGAAIGLLAVIIVVCAKRSALILSGVWFSALMLTPMVVALGAAAVLALRWRGRSTKLDQQRLVLLIALSATCSLVQFPFPVPIYLCYALPLPLLALVAIVAKVKKQRGIYALSSLVGLYLAFGVVILVPLHLAELTHVVHPLDELRLPRGGIRIEDEAFYEDLTRFLQMHAQNGVMYAGNNCPELYFLTGLKNVTRDDLGAPEEEVLNALQSDDLKLVVINEAPHFAGDGISPKVRAEVMREFPNHRQVGIFQVFWRE